MSLYFLFHVALVRGEGEGSAPRVPLRLNGREVYLDGISVFRGVLDKPVYTEYTSKTSNRI